MPKKCKRPKWTHLKQHNEGRYGDEDGNDNNTLEEEVAKYRAFLNGLRLQPSPMVFDADSPADTRRLIDLLWTGDFCTHLGSMNVQNPALVDLVSQLTTNSYTPKSGAVQERNENQSRNRLEGVLAMLYRMQSQKKIPLLTVLISLRAYKLRVAGRMESALACFFKGALLSDSWIEQFIDRALQFDPGPSYESLPGVGASCFDNLTIQVAYKAYSTQDSTGFRLDMTNWATMSIPRSIAVAHFDARQIWAEGLFPETLSRSAFASQFTNANKAVLQNQRIRFREFLQATRHGTLFDRPAYQACWTPCIETKPAMFGRLQGKYEDVEYELNMIRRHFLSMANTPYFVFIGGDGLSIDRMQHLLASNSPVYVDSTPSIIPMLGLSPHGEYHICHAGYRNFRPIIRVFAAALNNKQLVDDPKVSDYNAVRFGLSIIMRACGEYLVEISLTKGAENFELVEPFISKCEANVDLAWVVHMLHDFLYLWWDFKQSVRANDSRRLDQLWAEFVSLGRTTVANKTHYGVMAVMQVYYGCALHRDMRYLYHSIRTVHTGGVEGTNTGWDMIVERINDALKQDVTSNVSEDLIQRRLRDHRFLDCVDSGLDAMVYAARQKARAKMKNMDSWRRM